MSPKPKQLSTAKDRKNTQRRSFPRQRKFVFPRGVLIRRRAARKGWRLRHPFCCFRESHGQKPITSSHFGGDSKVPLEEGRGFCGMAFAPGAPRCSRENCGLFKVFLIAPEACRSYIRSSEGTQRPPRRGKRDFRNAVCAQCAALFPRALRVIQGFSAMPRKHPFSTERSFSRTVLATRGCSHEGPLRSTHLRGAKNVCSEPRVVLTMASGCPGRFRSAGEPEPEIRAQRP